jgi:tRNA G10  N-methylase Trm11
MIMSKDHMVEGGMEVFQDFVLQSLRAQTKPSDEPPDFRQIASRFYNLWFKENGTSYYILFKKNIRITNMQFAELISLLRCHIYSTEDVMLKDTLFVSADEFKKFFAELLSDTLIHKKEISNEEILAVTQQYDSIVKRVVVLNPYYGSCTIYLPPPLKLKADKLCAESGYIHSLGHLVYVRNMTKATEEELIGSIQTHIKKYPLPKNPPALFRIYSHEDFTKWDRAIAVDALKEDDISKATYASDLSHGLDDVKIQTRKAFFKTTNIIEVLSALKSKFGSILEIPVPGSFKKTLEAFNEKYKQNPERTFFLVNDAALNPNSIHPDQKKYYICYDQLWFNNDPFYIFDEDKPAWVSHTTIPHSLAAALINITRPWQQTPIRLIDPFGGSGTMLLESLKRSDIVAESGDIEVLSNLVAKDNLAFFRKSVSEVEKLRDGLKKYLSLDALLDALTSTHAEKDHPDFAKAKSEMDSALQSATTATDIGLSNAAKIEQLSYEQRLIFYVLLRTRLRHIAELSERRTAWPAAFMPELFNLVLRLNSHIAFLKLAASKTITDNDVPYAIGDYSKICWLNLDDKQSSREDSIRKIDATQLPKDTYDVIITDPPYGFNTKEEDIKLIELYRKFIWRAVAALRDGGQLVICCPHYSYSGRHVPVFIQPEFVIQQILMAASDHNKVARSELFSLPSELHGLKPPYYWEAPTALQRSILHFRFQTKRHIT